MALAEKVMKTRPLRISTAGPSLTRKPWISQLFVGVAIRVGLLFSAQGERSYLEADLRPGDALVFGRESVGLPHGLLQNHSERVWAIPTSGQVRSLNLSNAVAIVLFEALRRHHGLSPAFVE